MVESPFVMSFDPRTIQHLGVRMYSTLPPALAELISNAYDADAESVEITFIEHAGTPSQIVVKDDGDGLSFEDINRKFLLIGRNRRVDEGDRPSARFDRLPTGKKGLGKLALFGLAKTITIASRHGGKQSVFVLDWDELLAAEGSYRPRAEKVDEDTELPNGTEIVLTGLKRASRFDVESVADSLSRIFILDESFKLTLVSPRGDEVRVDNLRRYAAITSEFVWEIDESLVPETSAYSGQISGQLITSEKPLTPASGLRGITLFSRGKLVNAPEFFSSSASSHFYQYLTGWVCVDFIDGLADDVISTNRQSIDWSHPEMAALREFLAGIVLKVNADWRAKRQAKKRQKLKDATGIDTQAWLSTMPDDVGDKARVILNSLGGEDALESFTPVVQALHAIVPEYPQLHWRHLHEGLRERVRTYYENQQYGVAAHEGTKIYCERLREMTGMDEDGMDLVSRLFGKKPFENLPRVQLNALTTDSDKNIQEGQGHLSRGVITGFRNPMAHTPVDTSVPGIFSELDCLNVLSTMSYLFARLEDAKVNPPGD